MHINNESTRQPRLVSTTISHEVNMLRYVLFLSVAICVLAQYQDTQITRVKPLSEEERRLPVPKEKTRSIYLLNLVPIPNRAQEEPNANSPDHNQLGNVPSQNRDPTGRHPTLFLLQKVDDSGRLPDGIYYRPAEDETGTPPPAFVKNLTDLQSYLFARGPFKSPGRQ